MAGVHGGDGHSRGYLTLGVELFASVALGVGHIFERRLVFVPDDLVWRSLQKGLQPILRPETRSVGLDFVVLKVVAGCLFLEKRLFRIQLL